MKVLEGFSKFAVLLARIGVGISFLVLIVTVLIQVSGRTFGSSPVWTEELTRIALLYLVAFGAGLALRSGDLVNVDVISENLPGRAPWLLRLLSAVFIVGLGVYLLPLAWKFTSIGNFQKSPALGLQMSYVHFTVTLTLALLALFALLRVIGMVTGREDGLPNKPLDEE